MVLNIGQAFKMAWRSICGKKGRSALTILSIFIGIAAVIGILGVPGFGLLLLVQWVLT